MKMAIYLIVTLSAALSYADTTTLKCETEKGKIVSGTIGDFNLFAEECKDALFTGEVCFVGKRKEVLALLKTMSDNEVLGDEYAIINTWYSGAKDIKYNIYDGPNEETSQDNYITRCN